MCEVCSTEVCLSADRPEEVRIAEVCLSEVCRFKVGPHKFCYS